MHFPDDLLSGRTLGLGSMALASYFPLASLRVWLSEHRPLPVHQPGRRYPRFKLEQRKVNGYAMSCMQEYNF